jgi:hypothetical protein
MPERCVYICPSAGSRMGVDSRMALESRLTKNPEEPFYPSKKIAYGKPWKFQFMRETQQTAKSCFL